MDKITGVQVKSVVGSYLENNSILETAKATGLSTVKVRKILITEGLWQSDTSKQIKELLNRGMTTAEIAGTLYMSVKNVQAYMPYERGVYGGEDLSKDAIRSDKYRNRMKQAASMQVLKSTDKNKKSERKVEMGERNITELENKENKSKKVLRLHLELDMKYADEDEMQTLQKYGSVKESISRDILVPADITLHALNYAILRMFGWQNGHLHNFSLPETVFKKLTDNKYLTWSKMAGVYFRFPTENYEDIYWDDDYKEGESIKSWMKRKYTGPYKYKGYGEHYLMNQIEVKDMFARWAEITVHEFDFRAEKQPEPYNVKLKDATIDQVIHAFADVTCHELIERLQVSDILCMKGSNEVNFAEIKKYINARLMKCNVDDVIEEYSRRRFGSVKQKREFLDSYNIPVLPVTEQLIYSYDYGDGWKVLITCEDVYECNEAAGWTGKVAADLLEEVVAKYRPVCIAKDGIELVDDVGGIRGFCEMLKTIYETDMNDEEEMEERDRIIGWAEMMGWTGRRISPKQTL